MDKVKIRPWWLTIDKPNWRPLDKPCMICGGDCLIHVTTKATFIRDGAEVRTAHGRKSEA
jgi:hypothetical protein